MHPYYDNNSRLIVTMSNIVVFVIANSYTKPYTLPTQLDCSIIERTFPNSCITLRDLGKDQLLKHLAAIQNKNWTKSFDTALLFITGHGCFDSGNNLEMFCTNDMEKISINQIVAHFGTFRKIITIVDACQTRVENHSRIESQLPTGSKIVICCPISKGKKALCNKEIGSYFIYAICKIMKIAYHPGSAMCMNLILHSFSISFSSYMEKFNFVPKIYANSLARKENEKLIGKLQSLTAQTDATVRLTRCNNNKLDQLVHSINELIGETEKKIFVCKKKGDQANFFKYNQRLINLLEKKQYLKKLKSNIN